MINMEPKSVEQNTRDKKWLIIWIAMGLAIAALLMFFIGITVVKADCLNSTTLDAMNQTFNTVNGTIIVDLTPLAQNIESMCKRITYLENLTYNQSLELNSTKALFNVTNDAFNYYLNWTSPNSTWNSTWVNMTLWLNNLTYKVDSINETLNESLANISTMRVTDLNQGTQLSALSTKVDSNFVTLNDSINAVDSKTAQAPDYAMYGILAFAATVIIIAIILYLRQ
jgi:hypothetical protein